MIVCRKCGTSNPDGTRVCTECSTLLMQTGVRCPECGAMNPTGNVFCDFCGGRLIPLSAESKPNAEEGKDEGLSKTSIKGLSLPTIPLEGETAPPGEADEEGESSAWLSELRAGMLQEEESTPAEETAAPDPPASEGVETPDWLRELNVEPLEMVPPEAPPPTPSEDTALPQWLRELGPEPPSPAPTEATPEAASMPAWLEGLDAEPSSPAPDETPPAEDIPSQTVEVPDWLQELDADAPSTLVPLEDRAPEETLPEPVTAPETVDALGTEAPSAPAEETPAGEDTQAGMISIPDWLGQLEPETPEPAPLGPFEAPATESVEESREPEEAAAEPLDEAAASEESGIPEWLRELEEEAPTEPAAPPPQEPPVEGSIPEWLMESRPEAARTEAPETEAPVPAFQLGADEPPLEPGEIPDWLRQMKPGEAEPRPVAPPVAGLAPAEIPEWLQALRPAEEAGLPEEPAETEGLLEGLRGTLTASSLFEAIGKVEAAPMAGPSAATMARAELLQELINRPATAPQPKERERKTGWAIQRIVIGLLLVAAIIAPVAANAVGFEILPADLILPSDALSRAEHRYALQTYDAIEAHVQAGAAVLVAFEYGPSEADEMELVAEPLLLHLADRGARLIVVSTRPEGPMLASRLFTGLAADGLWEEQQAAQVANLGYVPGDAAGIQALLLDLAGRPEYWSGISPDVSAMLEGISSAEDVALVVVLAGQSTGLQAWIEQMSALGHSPPLVAGISARVEPMSRPYLETTGQLQGAVTGLVEGAAYEARLEPSSEHMAAYRQHLQSLTLSRLAAVGLMLVGAVLFLFRSNER